MAHKYNKRVKSYKNKINYVKYYLDNKRGTTVEIQVEKDKNNKDIDHFRK